MAEKETKIKVPKSDRLPGMEEPVIEELERLAKQYAKLRDKRQSILLEEVDVKGQLLGSMRKNKKEHYQHGKVTIDLVAEDIKVKVKIAKDEDGD